MGDELEVQIINSPYMTLEVDLGELIDNKIESYFNSMDQSVFTDAYGQVIEQIVSDYVDNELDVHDAVHDVVSDMGFVKSEDLDVDEHVVESVRSQLRQFNRLDSLDEACTLGEAFIEAVQKVANVSRVDMQQALNNQFKNATIKVEFSD